MNLLILVRSALSIEAARFDPPLTRAEQEQAVNRFMGFYGQMPEDQAYTEMLRTLPLDTLRR